MRRGLTTSLLVALAIVVAAGLMAVLSTQAIMASSDCAEHPVLANVAVSNDIAPAVQKAAQYFNRLHREINGHCAVVQVHCAHSISLLQSNAAKNQRHRHGEERQRH